MSYHLEILPAQQVEVLRALAPHAGEEGFHLAGGTALALRLGHRRSVDLDWFSPSWTGPAEELASRLRSAGIPLVAHQFAKGTLHGEVEGVHVSFLRYAYPDLQPVDSWVELDCRIASLQDLACMKLSAVTQRGTRRDFVDIAFVLKQGLSLKNVLDLYRAKYSVTDVGHVLVSLAYFDDAEREPMPTMLLPCDWEALKSELRTQLLQFAG